MATCTFLLENEIYDASLYPVILQTMRTILEKHNSLECVFLHLNQTEMLCIEAALTLRKEYPRKTILLTMIDDVLTGPEPVTEVSLDHCWLDRIIQIPYNDNRRTMVWETRRIMRILFRNSDYVITYVYPQLMTLTSEMLVDTQTCEHLTICDVTSPETHQFLQQCALQLPKEQQLSMKLRMQGVSYRAIGEQMNQRPDQISDQVLLTGHHLTNMIKERYFATEPKNAESRGRLMQLALGDSFDSHQSKGCCGILGFYNQDAFDYTVSDLFRLAFYFVLDSCSVDRFLMEPGSDTAAFSLLLHYLRERYSVRLPFKTLSDLGSKKANQDAIIQQSDILICNSGARKGLKQALKKAEKKPMLIIDVARRAEVIARPDFFQHK